MKNSKQKLSEILNIDNVDVSNAEIVELSDQPISNNFAIIDDDAEYARKNIKNLIEKGNNAMDVLINVAKGTEHPRAFEVAANMLKNLSDMNKDLLELHKKKSDLMPQGAKSNQTVNVDKAVFIGSTADLVKALKAKKEE